ncbi:MAG TPA: xanthine dehydrogenase molybdopterin binding subunit [Vicinamibacterales bacterium]|nr:xanthine dehydrogenase molybdopterin binding subunit [Vicinamibacterales bacterium]
MSIAGRGLPHESSRGHVTGDALYTDDLIGRFSGLLHAWPVLAPHAHALIAGIDVSEAMQAPGVAWVLTDADVPGEGDSGANRHDEPLFPSEVMYHHQPVAWVLAGTIEAAQQAASRVRVEYQPLPAILTIEEAIEAGSYLAEPHRIASGDVSGLDACALHFDGELKIGGQEHFYLETQAAIGWIDEAGFVSVHSSTQHPSETQEVVARVLGIPRNQVIVECVRMGGAFGGKEVQANPYAAIAALGAWKLQRPVRVRLSRELDIALTGKRHPYLVRYSAGFSADGVLQAVRMDLYSDGGWSLDLSEPVMWRSLFHVDNAYRLRAVDVTGRVCRTHKTSQTAFRGFGGPQGMIAIEEILSQAAARLRLPAHVVRERNFYREGDSTHYGQVVRDAGRIEAIWNRLKETSSFDERRSDIAGFNGRSIHKKRGLAITPVKFGISFTATFYNQAGALVLVYRDGTVQVNHGGTEMGQGLFTKVLQVAADTLGVTPAQVRVMPTRTDKVPNTSATAASSGSDLNGAAVADACARITARLAAVAAPIFDCDASDVRFEGGSVSVPSGLSRTGGEKSIAFAALCEVAYKQRVSLFAQGYYRTPDIHFDFNTSRGNPFHYYAYGAAVSEVEVDGFTGEFRLLRTDILQDVGDSISPLVDLGQIEGGFLQGVGWLTLEELLWDESGRLSTTGASTYKLPSWSEMPEVFNVDLLERATEPGVIMGSKAVGEPPLMLAFSVREAIRDAVAAFGEAAGVSFDSPATPERVFFAVRRARGSSATPRPELVEGRSQKPALT